jgi:hypothetical protein
MITIRFDRQKPMASVEFVVRQAPPNYALTKAEAEDRGEIQPVLSSAEFKTLVEGVRSAFEKELADGKFEVVRASGIVCHDANVYRPGILLLLQERGREGTIAEKGRERVTAAAEAAREKLSLG